MHDEGSVPDNEHTAGAPDASERAAPVEPDVREPVSGEEGSPASENRSPCDGCDQPCSDADADGGGDEGKAPEAAAAATGASPAVVPDAPDADERASAPTGPLLELGVAFPHNAKVYSFSSGGLRISIGDKVLVRTDKGVDLGDVVKIKGKLTPEKAEELTAVVRVATEEDLAHVEEQRERERRALEKCEVKISEHDLPMKLIDAHISFDNTRLVFLFTAEGRVD